MQTCERHVEWQQNMGIRDAHFFRRAPSEYMETTNAGGLISIGAIITICWLVLSQYNESFSAKRAVQLRLDSPLLGRESLMREAKGLAPSSSIRINFNISMLHLPCQFAQLHIADHVGSHKAGGARNIHRVRLSSDGRSLGLFEPHKYNGGADDKDLAGHVFPWHKKEHAQGDADHREQQTKKHLSQEQRNAVVEVESTIKLSGKGAHAGRRLLGIEDDGASPSPASPQIGSMPQVGSMPTLGAKAQAEQPKEQPAGNTSPSCPSWASQGECVSNSAYMLTACETSCAQQAAMDASICSKWAMEGRCMDVARFMTIVCPGSCSAAPSGPANAGAVEIPAGRAWDAAKPEVVEHGLQTPTSDLEPPDPDEEKFVPPAPFSSEPADMTVAQFDKLIADHPIVMVNFFAPWCFWSNKLTPTWLAVSQRLHVRAYSRSVKMIRIDCTTASGGEICRAQAIHAFPTVRIFRQTSHAFEPYEYGREENVIWLHLVKVAAEALVTEMNDLPAEERQAEVNTHSLSSPSFATQIAHVSKDLRVVMDRRAKGLDEDWSEDALSSDEEVKEDRDLLQRISEAVGSITGAKGVGKILGEGASRKGGDPEKGSYGEVEAEEHLIMERASDVVLGLLTGRVPDERGGGDAGDEMWVEAETHEGCTLFGYVEVSRAPGTLHISPHASRHSFDFSAVNTTHHIDHLSFGLELSARERARLPSSVRAQLTTLDGSHFVSTLRRETKEHHVNIMPTSYGPADGSRRIETYQFTATSQGRTRDILPHLMITYDVSPIHAHIVEKTTATTEFLVSLCAITGGAVSLFALVAGMPHPGS